MMELCEHLLRQNYGVLEIGCEWTLRWEQGCCVLGQIGPQRFEQRVDRKILDRFSTITVHAPFSALFGMEHLIDEQGHISALMMNKIKEAIETSSTFGTGTVTIHPDWAIPDAPVDRYWDVTVDACRELAEFAQERGVRIGAENCLPVTRDAEVLGRLIEAVDTETFGLTVDTGHFPAAIWPGEFGPAEYSRYYDTSEGLAYLNKMLFDVVENLSDHIFHFHLHDVTRCAIRHDHGALGGGCMDFPGLFEALSSRNFAGTMVLETLGGSLDESMRYMERFFEDTSVKNQRPPA